MKKKKLLTISFILICALALGACASAAPTAPMVPGPPAAPVVPEPPAAPEQAPDDAPDYAAYLRTVVDQAGRTVTIEGPVQRIVSGFYISTVAVVALNLEDKLVGIEARAYDRPIYALVAPQLIELPSVGTAREFNLEGCIALMPDLVILPIRQLDNAEILADLGIPVILVEPETPEKLMEMISLIAEAAGVPDRAETKIDFYRRSLEEIEQLTAGITEKPTVYMGGVGSYLTTSPAGMYQSYMIQLAGGLNAAGDIDGRSWVEISYEQILVMNPDVIIIPSEAVYGREDVLNNPQLARISAVQNGRVYQMPYAFGAWDSPVTCFTLGIRWLLSVLHEDIYSIETMREYAAAFYTKFYRVEIDTALIGRY